MNKTSKLMYRSHMKKTIKWICIVVGSGLAGLLLAMLYPTVADTIRHNRKLEIMHQSFSSLGHPAGTSSIARQKKVGLLSGQGNHCDYFVGELRSYTGETNIVREWYRRLTISGPDQRRYDLDILFLKDGSFTDPDAGWKLPNCCDESREWLYRTEDRKNDFYLVFCLLVGFEEPGGDWRCR
jgi:hypothetical protein